MMLQCSRGLTAAEIANPFPPNDHDAVLASMQPRPHGRGNSPWGRCPTGTAPALQCSRGLTAAEISHGAKPVADPPSCFNAAAASRPRKSSCASWNSEPGRPGFNAAAASRPRKCVPTVLRVPAHAASMQPRPHGRGNRRRRWGASPGAPCFNAAAASRPRKSGRGFRGVSRARCFNAAAASRPRKYAPRTPTRTDHPPLQCSRGLTAAEIHRQLRPRRRPTASASMQPRPHGRGN